MTRIVIIDKQELFREAIKSILSSDESLQIVGTGNDSGDICSLFEQHQPDLLITEIDTETKYCCVEIRRLINEYPDAKVIILTMHGQEPYISQAIQAGVAGFLLKEMNASAIIDAIHSIKLGNSYIHPKVLHYLLKDYKRLAQKEIKGMFHQNEVVMPYHLLTNRECEVLQLLAYGQSNQVLANTLSISEKTVKNHVSSILYKMNVPDRTNAVVFALKKGWVLLG